MCSWTRTRPVSTMRPLPRMPSQRNEAIRQSLTASRLIRKAIRKTPESWQLPSSLTVSIPPIIYSLATDSAVPGSHKFLFVRGLGNLIHISVVVVQQPTLEYEIWRAVEHLAINGRRTSNCMRKSKTYIATCLLLLSIDV